VRGAKIGRYHVLDRLGEGAMGVVYAAYDPELDRKIALKQLNARLGESPAARDFGMRLQREAQAMAMAMAMARLFRLGRCQSLTRGR